MRKSMRLHHLLWIAPLALVSIAIACGGSPVKSPTSASGLGESSGSTSGSTVTPPGTGGSGSSGTGTLSVMIKDSPVVKPSAVLVTFSEVSAHKSGDGTSDGEWVTLPLAGSPASRTCDLMRLVTSQDVLGTATFPAGHYTQLRVTVEAVTIYFDTKTTGPACAASLLRIRRR